jgi:cyclase
MTLPRVLLASLLLLASRAGADQPVQYFDLHDLGHGVWAAIEVPGSHAGGNAGFVVGDDGVLVVDSFGLKQASEAFLAAIRKVTDKPIRYVVDTHYHMDHLAGNGLFAEAGAILMAQRNVRAWSRTENYRILLPPVTTAETRALAELVPPSLLYRDGIEVYLGEKRVQVRVMPGHTGGDSVVVVPDAKVVFTGDLYWDHALPNLVDADTAAQIATLDALARDYPDARFVPGHGKFVTGQELDQWDMARAGDLRDLSRYLTDLRAAVGAALKQGKSGQALQDQVLPGLKQRYGGLFAFDFFAAKNIAQTEAELAGRKDVPKPVP